MNRKVLKRILGEIVTGKELIPLFVDSGIAPSVLYWALKEFLQHPNRALARKVAARKKVSPQYLMDRIGNLVDQVDEFRASNPYSTLQVTYQDDLSLIREQWKSLLKEWHPDKLKDEDEPLTKAQEINEAYRLLKSPEDRKSYDQQFAPLLAIVKDIEEQPHPSFNWGCSARSSVWKYGGIGGAVLAVGLLLWGVHHTRFRSPAPAAKAVFHVSVPVAPALKKVVPHAPVSSAPAVKKGASETHVPAAPMVKKATPVPPVPEVKKTTHYVPISSAPVVKKAAPRPHEAAPVPRYPTPPKEKTVPAPPIPTSPVLSILARLSGGGGVPAHDISSEIRCKKAEKQGIAGQALGRVGRSSCLPAGTVSLEIAKRFHPKVIARAKTPLPLLPVSPKRKVAPRQESPAPRKAKPAKAVPGRIKRQAVGSPKGIVRQYVRYYREGNYPGLFTLFDGKARENGVPIRDAMEDYKIFLRHLKIVRFDLKDTSVHKGKDRFIYSGCYTIEYAKSAGKGRITREGTLTIMLVRENRRWLIQELNYLSR